jgi:hypothetical protein
MVDWFSSVGNYLMSQRNIIPATHYDLSIMRHTEIENSFQDQIKPTAGISSNGGLVKYEVKSRKPASASISAHLPYLTLRQLSILGSLYVLKNKGGIRSSSGLYGI